MRGTAAGLLPAPLTHVLVHVEGLHVLEGQVPILVVLHQLLVASQRRAACGRTDTQTVSQSDTQTSVSQSVRHRDIGQSVGQPVSPTCGQPEREAAAGAGRELHDAVADVFGRPLAGLRVRLLDDQLHGGPAATPPS